MSHIVDQVSLGAIVQVREAMENALCDRPTHYTASQGFLYYAKRSFKK